MQHITVVDKYVTE